MKTLLLTVAGTSSRFSKSIGRDCLKCIYNENGAEESLLYRAVYKQPFDRYIIVGGYRFGELKEFVGKYFKDICDKIVLIENAHFADYGSGYSLYLGLKYAVETGFDQLVFAEGDLWVDDESFNKISVCATDAVTFNRDTIFANKAVIFYYDTTNVIHYVYDTSHGALTIDRPFLSVYNSGQIWKFTSHERLSQTFCELKDEEWQTTNLVFLQRYFQSTKGYAVIGIEKWLNCNTVEDFYKIGEQ